MNKKDIILKAIEDKKQEIINEYNARAEEISKENNIANICYLLTKTFNNTRTQSEIELEFLQSNLIHSFFNEANTSCKANYIVFENKDFRIAFSTYLGKEIIIKYKNVGYRKFYSCYINKDSEKLAEYLEVYLNNRTFKNFKALVDYNCRRRNKKNIIAQIEKYFSTYKRCNKELLDKIKEKQIIDKENEIEATRINKEYDERQVFANKFVEELLESDLKVFLYSDWTIRYDGIEITNK